VLKVRVPAAQSREPAHLVATITMTNDLTKRDESQTAAASIDDVLVRVRAWLEKFVEGSTGDEALTKP
jgi:hypothetical protein